MDYKSSTLEVLKGLEPVKQSPGMFIGDVNVNGLHQLIWEPLDNSIDESLAGFCTKVVITLTKDGYVEIEDNGRGIPTDIHPKENISGVELVLTRLHAGGKFKRKGGAYKTSGGLHGVGVSCTNALSEHLIAIIKRDQKIHKIEFKQGFIYKPLEQIGDTEDSGTIIKFKPDSSVFEILEFDRNLIERRLKQLAYLNDGLSIIFKDERKEEDLYTKTYFYPNGLKDYVIELIKSEKSIFDEPLIIENTNEDLEVKIAINYLADKWDEKIISFANNIYTREGGTHVQAFNRQISNILTTYANQLFPKRKEFPTIEDYKQGLIAVISIKLPSPHFVGQTKDKLTNGEVSEVIIPALKEKLTAYFDLNPNLIKQVIEKSFRAMDARLAAKKAKEQVQKQAKELYVSSDKFIDCISKNPEEREIFIVEGDSAGGNARTGRDKNTQAILSLRGKPLNTQNLNLTQVLDNKEFNQLIGVIGCGVGPSFTLENLRYHKIIILGDADVDGAHISIILLTFFFKYFEDLIKNGYIYVATPPLYKIKKKNGYIYLKDDKELENYKNQYGNNVEIGRFKGLGEMNVDELWESTMNPSNRTLLQVTINDKEKISQMFEDLMGKMNSHKRRELIEEKGYLADIDI